MTTTKRDALDELSELELRTRLVVVTKVIREAQADGDDRWRNVIPQQRRLNRALVAKIREVRRRRGEPDRAPVVVRMRPLSLATRAPRL